MAWYFNQNYPWPGMLLCAPIIGLWYWCTDQYIVQRALGAPNEREARRGTIFAAFLKLLPVFIFIVPGMIALALARTGRAPELGGLVDSRGEVIPAAAQGAFPMLVQTVVPAGLRGLVVAGLLAALMSSLAGAFNASSTLFTIDFYRKFRPRRLAGATGVGRACGHSRDGAHRAVVDSRHSRRARPLRIPAGRAGVPRPANRRGVLPGCLRQPAHGGGLSGGAVGRLCAGHPAARGGYTGDARARRLRARL